MKRAWAHSFIHSPNIDLTYIEVQVLLGYHNEKDKNPFSHEALNSSRKRQITATKNNKYMVYAMQEKSIQGKGEGIGMLGLEGTILNRVFPWMTASEQVLSGGEAIWRVSGGKTASRVDSKCKGILAEGSMN